MKKIIKYKKYKNLIDKKSFEVIMSFLGTVIILLFFCYVSLYSNFFDYQDLIISFLESSIFAFIGLIGFLISALSITVGMINRNVGEEIIKIELEGNIESNSIEKIIYDYIFLGILISIEIFIYIILIFLLTSTLELMSFGLFIVVVALLSYLFLFTIFSSVSILGECYEVFLISIEAERNNDKRKIVELRYETLEESFKKEYPDIDKSKFLEDYIIGLIYYIEYIEENNKRKDLYYKCLEDKYEVLFNKNEDDNHMLLNELIINTKNNIRNQSNN